MRPTWMRRCSLDLCSEWGRVGGGKREVREEREERRKEEEKELMLV